MMNQPLIPIFHYGLHTSDEGITFLHQGKAPANFVGIKRSSPFQQRPFPTKACPHNMNPSVPMPDRHHWDQFQPWLRDPLVSAMLPLPKVDYSNALFLNDPQNDMGLYLTILSKLTSPIYPLVRAFNTMTEKRILEELTLTNVAPLILTGLLTSDQTMLNRIVKSAQLQPRKLIVTGASEMLVHNPMERIKTNIRQIDYEDLVRLPLEQLGVFCLRRAMRNEVIDAPLPQRDSGERNE